MIEETEYIEKQLDEVNNHLKSIDNNVHALCVILADGLKELTKLMEEHDVARTD